MVTGKEATAKALSQSTMLAVISKSAKLYLWDQIDRQFLKQADVLSSINSSSSSYDYWITVDHRCRPAVDIPQDQFRAQREMEHETLQRYVGSHVKDGAFE